MCYTAIQKTHIPETSITDGETSITDVETCILRYVYIFKKTHIPRDMCAENMIPGGNTHVLRMSIEKGSGKLPLTVIIMQSIYGSQILAIID